MTSFSRLLASLAVTASILAQLDSAGAQGPAAVAGERERPAIQAVLERLLAAEQAKDKEAVRRYVTAGTLALWDWYAREENDPSLRTVLGDIGRVEIESLRIDPRAVGRGGVEEPQRVARPQAREQCLEG